MPINNNTIQYSNLSEKPVEGSRELLLRLHGIDSKKPFVT